MPRPLVLSMFSGASGSLTAGRIESVALIAHRTTIDLRSASALLHAEIDEDDLGRSLSLPCVMALTTHSRTAMLVQCSVSSSSPTSTAYVFRDLPARGQALRSCCGFRDGHPGRPRPSYRRSIVSRCPPSPLEVKPARRVKGTVRLAGDKSISHRYALLAALADGPSTIESYSSGRRLPDHAGCLRQLAWSWPSRVPPKAARTVDDRGPRLAGSAVSRQPATARCREFRHHDAAAVRRAGGASVRRLRSRRRVAQKAADAPRHGAARADGRRDRRRRTDIRRSRFRVRVAFTASRTRPPCRARRSRAPILLCGLQADGTTVVAEAHATRNHTELALRAFGAVVTVERHTRQRRRRSAAHAAAISSCPGIFPPRPSGWPPLQPSRALTSRLRTSG